MREIEVLLLLRLRLRLLLLPVVVLVLLLLLHLLRQVKDLSAPFLRRVPAQGFLRAKMTQMRSAKSLQNLDPVQVLCRPYYSFATFNIGCTCIDSISLTSKDMAYGIRSASTSSSFCVESSSPDAD